MFFRHLIRNGFANPGYPVNVCGYAVEPRDRFPEPFLKRIFFRIFCRECRGTLPAFRNLYSFGLHVFGSRFTRVCGYGFPDFLLHDRKSFCPGGRQLFRSLRTGLRGPAVLTEVLSLTDQAVHIDLSVTNVPDLFLRRLQTFRQCVPVEFHFQQL